MGAYMLCLNTGETLTLELAIAAFATQPEFSVSWIDTATDTPGSSKGVFTDTTPVTAVASPASGERLLSRIDISNGDTANVTVIVKITGGTSRSVIRREIAAGESSNLLDVKDGPQGPVGPAAASGVLYPNNFASGVLGNLFSGFNYVSSGQIGSGQISQNHLASGVSFDLQSGSVQSGMIGDGAVLSGSIASGQVGWEHLASGVGFDLQSGSVQSGMVGDGAILSGSIGSGQISPIHLSSGTNNLNSGIGYVSSGQIGSGQIASGHLASGLLANIQIGSGGIVSGMIGDGAVVSGSIASGQVGWDHLASGVGFDLQSGSVKSGMIGNEAVLSGSVGSGQIGIIHIASGDVNNLNSGYGFVSSGQIGSGQIASGHLASGLLANIQIGSGGIVSGMIGDGAVVSGSIASGQIGWEHLASGVGFDLQSGSVQSGMIGDGAVLSGQLGSGQVGFVHLASGTLNLNSGIGFISSGQIGSGQISSGMLASGLIAAITIGSGGIQSGMIGDGAVLSGNIGSGQIGYVHLTSGTTNNLASGFGVISSGQLGSGQVGFTHLSSGTLNLNSGIGYVSSGQIGSGQIASGHLASGLLWNVERGTSMTLYLDTYQNTLSKSYVCNNEFDPDAPVVRTESISVNSSEGEKLFFTFKPGAYYGTYVINRPLLEAGLWEFISYLSADTLVSATQAVFRVYSRYTVDNTDTELFSIDLPPIDSLTPAEYRAKTLQQAFLMQLQRLDPALPERYIPVVKMFVKTASLTDVQVTIYSDGLILSGPVYANRVLTPLNCTVTGDLIHGGWEGDIASGTIDYYNLSPNAVLSGNIASGQVGAFHLSSGIIIAATQSGQIQSGKIGNGAISSGQVASGQIGWSHLASGVGFDLQSGSVQSGMIGNGAVVSGGIGSGQVGFAHLASGTLNLNSGIGFVSSGQIGSGQIASGHLASGLLAAMTFTLTSGAVQSGMIGNGAVVSGSIASGQIGQFHISSGAVQSGNLASGVVDWTLWNNTAGTGLQAGGILSFLSGQSSFIIGSGAGYVVDNHTDPLHPTVTHVEWPLMSGIAVDSISSGNQTQIAITASGTVFQQLTTPFTVPQVRDLIILGKVVHPNKTTVQSVTIAPRPVIDAALDADDLARALGIINVTGNVFAYNGANLNLNKSIGQLYRTGGGWASGYTSFNFIDMGPTTALSFQYRYQNSAGGFSTSAMTTSVDPDQYDDGSGTLQPVPSNKYTIQRIYLFSTGSVYLTYGQAYYNSLADAISAVQFEAPVIDPNFQQDAALRCFLITKEGVSVLNNTNYTNFITTGKLGETSSFGANSLLASGFITSGYIGNAAVVSGSIASGQVGWNHLASGVGFDLQSGSVQSGTIGNGAVVSGSIASGQVEWSHVSSGFIIATVKSGQIGSGTIADGAVRSGQIGAGRVGLVHLASGAISLYSGAGYVSSGQIGSGQIASGHLASGLLANIQIGSGGIKSGMIGDGAVVSGSIASGQVGWSHLASGVGFDLQSGSVQSGMIGNSAVLSGSIGSGQIGYVHMASGTINNLASGFGVVSSGQIASGQIGYVHLASGVTNNLASGFGVVSSGQVGSGVLGYVHLSSGTINNLASGFGVVLSGQIGSGQISFNHIASGVIPASSVNLAFMAQLSTQQNNVTGDGTRFDPVCDTVIADTTGSYNQATGVFTAPVTGRYILNFNIFLGGLLTGHTQHKAYITTSNREYAWQDNFTTNAFVGYRNINVTCIADLDAGDTAYPGVQIYNSTKVVDIIATETRFEGALLNSAVLSGSISSGLIQSGQIGNAAVLSGTIGSGQISFYHLASGLQLTSGVISSGFIGNAAVLSGSIGSGQIASGHLASGLLANLTFSITSGAVQSGMIGNGAVVSGSIASGQIGHFHLRSGLINNLASGFGVVSSGQIGSGQIWNTHTASGFTRAIGACALNGFVRYDDTLLTTTSGVFKINPASGSYDFYSDSRKFTKSGEESISIVSGNQLWYVYFDTEGAIQLSPTPWSITSDNVPAATVYMAASGVISSNTVYAIGGERHGYKRDRNWHEWAHDTIGARYNYGLTTTVANTTFSVAAGSIFDEDIEYVTSAPITNCRMWYRNTGAGSMRFDTGITTPTKGIQYDNAGALANVSLNSYWSQWIYFTNDPDYPVYIVLGQNQSSSIATIRANSNPTISGLTTLEWKLIYRAIFRNVGGNPIFTELTDYRTVSTGPANAAVLISHPDTVNRDAADQHPATSIAASGTANLASGNLQDIIFSIDAAKTQFDHDHISSGAGAAILSGAVGSGQIGYVHLASGTINNLASGFGVVSSGQIGSGQIASGHLASGLLANITVSLASGVVQSGHIGNEAVLSGNIGSGQVGYVHLASGTINNLASGFGVVSSGQIGSGQIASGHLASGLLANLAGALTSGQVTSGYIGDAAVLSGSIGSGQIGYVHLASGTINNLASGFGVVSSGQIGSGQIASGHLASGLLANLAGALTSGQVTSGYIGNAAVLSGSIGSGQVGYVHLASGTINNLASGFGVVSSGQIGSGQVASGHLASGVVWGFQNDSDLTYHFDPTGMVYRKFYASYVMGVTTTDVTVKSADGEVLLLDLWSYNALTVTTFNRTSLEAGIWEMLLNLSVDSAAGDTRAILRVYKADVGTNVIGDELFSMTTDEINSLTPAEYAVKSQQTAFFLNSTFYISSGGSIYANTLVFRVFVTTTNLTDITVTLHDGEDIVPPYTFYDNRLRTPLNATVTGDVITDLNVASGALRGWNMADETIDSRILGSGAASSGRIGAAAVLSGNIASGQISFFHLASGLQLTSGRIGSGLLGNGSVVSGSIASGQIGWNHLASGVGFDLQSGSVQSGMIGNAAVLSGSIGSGQIGYVHLESGTINNLASGFGVVSSGQIGSGQVGEFHLASGQRIASGTIQSGNLGLASVLSGNIGSGQVGEFHLASGQRLASGVIGSGLLGNGAVVSGSIASGQIGSPHIASGGVLSGNIGSGQIGEYHLASGQRLASGTIQSGNLGLASVLSGNIGSGQIASGHMATSFIAALGAVVLTSGQVQSGHIGNAAVLSGSIGSGQVWNTHFASGSYHVRRVVTTASDLAPTPNADTTDVHETTALSGLIAWNAPTGTLLNKQLLEYYVYANWLSSSSWNSGYAGNAITLPAFFQSGKRAWMGFEYDAANSTNKWNLISYAAEA